MSTEAIATLLKLLISRASYDGAEAITDASDYSRPDGFFLYVGTEGDVTFTTMKGQTMTKNMVVGYHPIRMASITGATTTATDLIALFP